MIDKNDLEKTVVTHGSWIVLYPFEEGGINASPFPPSWFHPEEESMINGYERSANVVRQNRVSSTFSLGFNRRPFPKNRDTEENRFPRGKQVEAADRRLWSRSDVSEGDISQMAFINCLKRYFETRSCRSAQKRLRVMLCKWGIFVYEQPVL